MDYEQVQLSNELKKKQAYNVSRKEVVEQKKREVTAARLAVEDRTRKLVRRWNGIRW